jgi:sec-independent protein translocase protein TatC
MNLKIKRKNQKRPPNPAASKPFIQHLDELRTRFFKVLIVILICAGIGYLLHEQLLSFLIKPLGQPIYYTTPGGGFDLVFKISILFGTLLAMPFIVYQILAFIKPALPKISIKKTFFIIIFSWLLMCLGVSLAYFLSLPAALFFLNSFGTPEVKSLISSRDYLSFVMLYLGGFGLTFQLPLVLLLINSFKKLSVKGMFRYLKFIILGSFIFAAILTPTPDLFNQTITAIPIVILYIFSIVMVWIANRKRG